MYLSYTEYQDMGGALDKPTFDNYSFEAETIIDWYTFNRLQNEEEIPNAVKRLMYALIHLLQVRNTSIGSGAGVDVNGFTLQGTISKQSNDGVSTEYSTLSAGSTLSATDAEVKKLIRFYLSSLSNSLGRKLLYKGVYPGE